MTAFPERRTATECLRGFRFSRSRNTPFTRIILNSGRGGPDSRSATVATSLVVPLALRVGSLLNSYCPMACPAVAPYQFCFLNGP
jgi:hypothetical protein